MRGVMFLGLFLQPRYTLGPLMRFLSFFLTLFCCSLAAAATLDLDEQKCQAFVRVGENYKLAHQNEHCLNAANAGAGSAQYSVGMAFGYADDPAAEQKYYQLAANNLNIAAYLALGHALSEAKPWEAIYWYQRYIATRYDGWGYAALLVSRIFEKLGDPAQAAYWLDACRSSPYEGCKK
jgi:hypothetical protein